MLVNTDVSCEELVSLIAFNETFVESLAKTNYCCFVALGSFTEGIGRWDSGAFNIRQDAGRT